MMQSGSPPSITRIQYARLERLFVWGACKRCAWHNKIHEVIEIIMYQGKVKSQFYFFLKSWNLPQFWYPGQNFCVLSQNWSLCPLSIEICFFLVTPYWFSSKRFKMPPFLPLFTTASLIGSKKYQVMTYSWQLSMWTEETILGACVTVWSAVCLSLLALIRMFINSKPAGRRMVCCYLVWFFLSNAFF